MTDAVFEHGQLVFASQNRPSCVTSPRPDIFNKRIGPSDDRLGQGSLNHQAPIFLISFGTHLRRDQMNWFSVQANAAIIAGVVSLSITLIMVSVAIILTNRKVHHNFNLEFAAEGVAREMLMVSMAETNCAKWRRESVPVGLREKGFEAPAWCFCVDLNFVGGLSFIRCF
jgi:hypothetical protein